MRFRCCDDEIARIERKEIVMRIQSMTLAGAMAFALALPGFAAPGAPAPEFTVADTAG